MFFRTLLREPEQVVVGDIPVAIVRKCIRHVHLRVCAPHGAVRISAPMRMNLDTIKQFVLTKTPWIKQHQERLRTLVRPAPAQFVEGEQHYFLGKPYPLRVHEQDVRPRVAITGDSMALCLRPDTAPAKRRAILDGWYRQQLKEIIPGLIAQYEARMSVRVEQFGIKKMKTRWGTCNRAFGRIWLNLELAKHPREHIEYIVVHEMVHFLERRHNTRFASLMDQYFANWRTCKAAMKKNSLG